jgi:hypothetical protein
MTIWLRIEPEIALARDRDFPLSYYERADAAYSQLSRWVHVSVISTTDIEPEVAACHVRRMLSLDDREPIAGNLRDRVVSQKRT